MDKRSKYEDDVTCNFASSLGAAIRNSLSNGMSAKSRAQDAKTASERLLSLLQRMIELEQFDDKIVVNAMATMLHQMGDLSNMADYCAEHKLTHIETAKKIYVRYSKSLKAGDELRAKKDASLYNYYLRCAGGPEKHPTETYLSMGVE